MSEELPKEYFYRCFPKGFEGTLDCDLDKDGSRLCPTVGQLGN